MAGGTPRRSQPSRAQTTMAVVFSDIVGSTALRNQMGEVDFTTIREAHDTVAAELVEACGGQVVRWQGDGLVAAFSSAGEALEYASMLQPSVDGLRTGEARFDLRIGIGLGDVLNETTGDFDGPAFVDAARLCDAAEPRQVLCTDLVSRAARAFANEDFGPAISMALKGLGTVEVREFLRRGSPTASSGLAVSVLGPLRAERAGRELEIGGPKERHVLALLAAASGRVVSIDELIEALWADDPPRTAERSVHAYVARLRKTLEPSRNRGAPPRVVVTEGRGYRLVLGPDALDSARFERLATAARADLANGHALRARRAVDEALGLWRGSAFDEHFDAERCAQEARRLEEVRQLAVEDLTTARLELGEAAELVSELETLVAQHPWQERLWANLMLALYRAGRQSDALRTFQRARSALVDELGVEPGPELRHLEAAILEHDPALLTASPGAAQPSRRLPAALDPGGAALVGREDELGLLRDAWERAFAGTGEFVAVVGPDGVGKTRLVAELAVDASDTGALVLHARCDAADRGPEPLFDRALRGAGAQFSDVPNDGSATPGAALARFLASWSGGRPVLLSLDDLHVADTATVEALADLAEWSASAPLLVVATFRPDTDDYGETGPGRVVLRPLSRDRVRDIAAIYRPAWGDGEIDELVAETGGVPLAVHRVASEWAQEATRRQVHAAAERATEARVRLVATRGDLADGIEGLQRLIEQRQLQLAPVVADAATARVPYRGLEAFDADDADLFFGRDQLLATLVARVASAPIVIVVGASGSGKSSLVQAGLLPALGTGMLWETGTWSSTTVAPGSDPARALDHARASASSQHHVVVVDPLEELWTACNDPSARAAFCDTLVAMARDERFALVACIRADFVDRVSEHAPLAALVSANTLFVPPMTADELRRVVEGPAQRTGLTVEPQLVEAVIADVEGRPGALPLLSTALLATWERRERRTITLEAYRSAGGVASAIAAMADGCYDALTPAQQRAARRILLHLAGEENGVDVRRRVPLATLGVDDDPDTRVALDALVARRLVIVDQAVAEVAHEALLRDWPRLARWLDEDRTGRRLHQRLAVAATAWVDADRDPSELYRGTRLQGAIDWADDHADDLAPFEREFLDASRADAARELEQARTQARVETRRSRRLRFSLVGIVLLLVVALITGGLALRSRDDADATALRADANRLATLGATGHGLDGALMDAVEGVRLDDSGETRTGLLSALQRAPRALRVTHTRPGSRPQAVHVDPSGSRLAVESNLNTVDVYNARTLALQASFPSFQAATFLPDGRLANVWVVPGTIDDPPPLKWRVVVRDLRKPERREFFFGGMGGPAGIAASEASHVLVAAAFITAPPLRLAVYTWNLDAPGSEPMAQFVAELPPTAGPPGLLLSPDGTTAYVTFEGSLDAMVFDARTLTPQRRLPVTGAAALSPDGTRIATSLGPSRGGIVTDTATGEVVTELPPARVEDSTSGTFAPSGNLAVGYTDGRISLWAVANGSTPTPVADLSGHERVVRATVFSRDGREMWSTSLDGTIVRWDIDGRRSFFQRFDETFRPTGSATASDLPKFRFPVVRPDGAAVYYFFADHVLVRPLFGHRQDPPPGVEIGDSGAALFSADSRALYVASNDNTLRRFDVSTGAVTATRSQWDPGVFPVGIGAGRGNVVIARTDGIHKSDLLELDAGTLQTRAEPVAISGPLTGALGVSRDGRYAAAVRVADLEHGNLELVVIDLRARRVDAAVPLPVNLRTIVFDPTGNRLALGTFDGRVMLVDRRHAKTPATSRVVADGSVNDVLFTKFGIVTAQSDGVTAILDPNTLRTAGLLEPAPGNTDGLLGLHDGHTLVVSLVNPRGAVAAFDLRPRAWLAHACKVAGPDLPPSHWREVLPDREHVEPCS